MNNIPTASQIIAALVVRLGGGPVTLTSAELSTFGSSHPTVLQSNDDYTFTLSVEPDRPATYWPSDVDIERK